MVDETLNTEAAPEAVDTPAQPEAPVTPEPMPAPDIGDTKPIPDIPPAPDSGEELNKEAPATPVRTLTGGLALMANKPTASNDGEMLRNLQQSVAEFTAVLDNEQEQNTRYRIAADRIQAQARNIRNLIPTDAPLSPQLHQAIKDSSNRALSQDIDHRAKDALEEQAVEQVRDYSAAGRDAEARIALRQLDPTTASSVAVIDEHAKKRLILSSMAEKFDQEKKQESWIHWGISGLLSIPDSILLGNSFSALGNVEDGKGGYQQGGIFRLLFPGTELKNQIEAIDGMTAAQLKDYYPTLEANIRSNANNLKIIGSPTTAADLSHLFVGGITPEDVTSRNRWAAVDVLGITPFGTIGKIMSIPKILTMSGARRAAELSVQNAAEAMVKRGSEDLAMHVAMDSETVLDNMLPSAINPMKIADVPGVALGGDVNDGIHAAELVARDLGLSETERFLTKEELAAGAEGTLDKIRERTGLVIKDHEVTSTRLVDGSMVHNVEATLGKAEGGGFATREEAVNHMQAHGMVADDENLLQKIETSVETLDQQGYTLDAYHGTTQHFDDFTPSSSGKTGRGVYLALNPKDAGLFAGIKAGKAVEGQQIRPVRINPDKIFGLKNINGYSVEEANQAANELGLKVDFGNTLQSNGRLNSAAVYEDIARSIPMTDTSPILAADRLNELLVKKGYQGVATNDMVTSAKAINNRFSEVNIFNPAHVRSRFEPATVKDLSQQWFGKVKMDIPDTAFLTTTLNPPRQSFLSKFWKTTSQTSDRRLFDLAARSDQKLNRLYKVIQGDLTKTFRTLGKTDRMWLNQILAKGDKEGVWFTDSGFSELFERATGKLPGEQVKKAYEQYMLNNNLEYVLRNAGVYKDKVIRGFESAKFSAMGDQFDTDIVVMSGDKAPQARVYNLSDDVHLIHGEHSSPNHIQLTHDGIKELKAKGYTLFRTEKEVALKDGTTVNHFIAKKGDLEIRPLRYEQLAYKAGGHRLYADKYFVKQAKWGQQADTGSRFLKSPDVHITAPNIKEARDWADVMNAARRAVADGENAAYLDEHIFAGNSKRFPSGEDFIKGIESGSIDKDEPFEALFDREQPSAYSANKDVSNFLDEEEVGFNGYYRTTGKMYYSGKGEQLKDFTGEWAPTIDPFEAQSRALNNVARMSSFADFKVTSMDRWVDTYRKYLNIRDLPADAAASKAQIFNAATVARDTPISARQMIEGQRESIKRILGFESEWDRGYRNWVRSTAEWVVGDSDSPLRKWASEATFKLAENNPVNWLRGWAFDMKLGLMNPGQLLMQSGTMISAVALSPSLGLKGVSSVPFVRAYMVALRQGTAHGERILETLANGPAPKLMGFADKAEFKGYVKDAIRSGFFDLGDTHVMVNSHGAASTFGLLRGGTQSAREMGRFFFYEAEVWNRLTAYRIAYGEAVERFGKATSDIEFRNFVSGRAENYAFNMSNTSKAAWQTGVLSIPTQFWAYNVRMIEALIGNNFTAAQKLRLAAVQAGLLGSAGLPVVAGVSEMIKEHYGVQPKIDTMLGTIERGAVDRMIYELTGADVELSKRWGTGSWATDLARDMMGMSAYNEKSFAELVGGATYSIMATAAPLAWNSAKAALATSLSWMTSESGSEKVDIAEDDLIALMRQVSTVNNYMKAKMIWQYGVLTSSKGTVLATKLPAADAIGVALGLPPAEVDEVSVRMAPSKARSAAIDEMAKKINNLHQEAFSIPDKFDVNRQKVNILVNMIPPDMRKEVLHKVHKTRDMSVLDGLMRREQQLAKVQEVKGTTP